MIIYRSRDWRILAHGEPAVTTVHDGRVRVSVPRALKQGGIDMEISISFTELEQLLADAKHWRPK